MKFLTPVALTLLSSSDSSSSGQFLYVSEYVCFFINSHLLSTAFVHNSVLWGFFGFQTVKILWEKMLIFSFLFKVDVTMYVYMKGREALVYFWVVGIYLGSRYIKMRCTQLLGQCCLF